MPLFGFTNVAGSVITQTSVAIAQGTDADAQAFIDAASITDSTQISAVNQLVLDLKGYNIWTKMKAIYPVLGGSASSHAVNLVTPGTYNLTFSTGWTHASTGMTPNGTSAYADSSLSTSAIGLNSVHLGFYSRTNSTSSGSEMGALQNSPNSYTDLALNQSGVGAFTRINSNGSPTTVANADTRGFYVGNRTASNVLKLFKNSNIIISSADVSNATTTRTIFIGGVNNAGTPSIYSNRQCAFASIGDGLTDTEAANFYTAVQAYQTTLGRSVGTQTVSDSDAQAFINAATIVDQVEATAVNNLVIGLKADSLWTKMKAIYPIVGGSASSHAVNLKTPGTYNLTFSTGWTHSSSGALPNGTNAYANTFLTPSTALSSINNSSFSFYNRTSNAYSNSPNHGIIPNTITDRMYVADQSPTGYQYWGTENVSFTVSYSNVNRQGFYTAVRTASNSRKTYRNGAVVGSNTGNDTGGALSSISFFIGAANGPYIASTYTNNQIAFASIGDGLTDTEASNFYTAVQNLQTTLNRQV